ncbi:Cell division protein FtsH [Minicystis rosea]|nr:Cell division protein FtsH [Minicystis rosea]
MKPYASSSEHLLDEIERLDLLMRMAVFRARRMSAEGAPRAFSATEEDVDTVLGRPPGQPIWAAAPAAPALAKVQALAEQKAAEIAARQAESARRGIPLRLSSIAARFALDRAAMDVLLIALAPELDVRYERLFVYLNDDVSCRRPTVAAALGLLCASFTERLAARAWFAAAAPLRRHALLHVEPDPSDRRCSLLRCALQLDERIIAYLHDSDALDPVLAPHARLIAPRTRLDDLLLPGALKQGLSRFVLDHLRTGAPGPIVYLQGPRGSGKKATAEALAGEMGSTLLVADMAALAAAGDQALRETVSRFGREAVLQRAVIHWDGIDALLSGGAERAAARTALLAAIETHPGAMFLAGAEPWEPSSTLVGRAFLRVELPRPSLPEQMTLWTRALDTDPASTDGSSTGVDLEVLTSMFRLNGGQIRDAAAAARALARFRDGSDTPTLDDLGRACRLHTSRELTTLARSVPPQHRWEDLVLPGERLAQLKEICAHVKHRSRVLGAWGFDRKLSHGKGLCALFVGPPGTGKTMAAGVIAGELGLALYHVDLSTVVSKYIGETEKHLGRLFDDAEASNAVLLFDEADAIFGKRTEARDAHDRHANLETSYLLQRIDAYQGAVILSTNFARNMDEAFLRRLQFIVDFPLPNLAERLRIWDQIWPSDMPRDEDLDAAFLARRLEVSGGHIRNMALSAAFLAAEEGAKVGMRHVLHAARRELAKMGKMVDREALAYRPGQEMG